jgi:serine protease inhibitor
MSPASLQLMLAVLSTTTDDPLKARLVALSGNAGRPSGGLPQHVAIWVPVQLTLVQNFESQARERFGATVFTRSNDGATQASVARWLRSTTEGRISAPTIRDNSLAIATSLTLDAHWLRPFDRHFTREGLFHGAAGTRRVFFMNGEWIAQVAHTAYADILRLKANDGQLVDFLLPKDAAGSACGVLRAYANGPDVTFVSNLIGIELPKFHVTTDWTDINGAIRRLGVGAVVDMTVRPLTHLVHQGPIAFDEVRQSTSISVDEQGVVGASGTIADIPLKSPPGMKFRRPFAFIVWEKDGQTAVIEGVFQ